VFGLPALVLCGREGIIAVVVALVLLGLLVRWCVQRIGGYTGDTLGAAQQITETGFYVALLAAQASAL
jgi:adenosylcobinamide-GDP ribazoletransferase